MDKQNEATLQNRVGNMAYSERVTRLLIACVESLCKFIDTKDILFGKLQQLNKVLKKAIGFKPVSGLAKEIEDFCNRKLLEDQFNSIEKEGVKEIIIELSGSLKSMVDASGKVDEDLNQCLVQVQSVNNETDVALLKDILVHSLQEIQTSSRRLRKELEESQQTTVILSERLEQSKAEAMIDPLTQVYNRQAYDVQIGQAVREFNRTHDPFALLIVDIDHFKKFNDTHGHMAGDHVLAFVAATIKSSVRDSDPVFRYGGEEFVLILKKVMVKDAEKIAEKVRRNLERDRFIDKEKEFKVTVSIGLALIEFGETVEKVFERADKALYESKKHGRNRVYTAPSQLSSTGLAN